MLGLLLVLPLLLVTFALSFVEAGIFLGVASGGEASLAPDGKDAPEASRRYVGPGKVIAWVIVTRIGLTTALSIWMIESVAAVVASDQRIAIVSTVLTMAVVFTEVFGKVLAIRQSARSVRAARSLSRFLARWKAAFTG